MKNNFAPKIIPITLALLAAILLYTWVNENAASKLTLRLPTRKTREDSSAKSKPKQIKGQLVKFDGVPSNEPGKWPRFRGPNFDNISDDESILARSWPDGGPKVLWSVDVGEGYAGPAVLNGRVYLIDYDRDKSADAIRCLSLDDGREIWRYSYPVKIKRNHGMSRTVPAVTDKYIVTMGPKCHLTCLNSLTGEFRWMLDLVNDFNATVPPWYAGQCPLIDDGKAIIATGGDALMIAVDCETGRLVWQTPNPKGWKMTHSSIVPTEFTHRRMYVYCGSGGVAGVAADNGSILWQTTDWKIRIANIPSPLIIDEGLIFLSGGYNAGSMMLRLKKNGDAIRPEPVFRLKPQIFGSPQHTPIYYKGYIYGVRPDGQLVCLDTNGRVVWTSTSANRFGLGPYIIANGLLYVMNDSGLLTLAEASPAGFVKLAQAKVLDGPDSWGPMAVASGRLILRDMNRMICIDLTEK